MNCFTSRWLKECVELVLDNSSENVDLTNFVIDRSLVRFLFNLFNQIVTFL